MRVPRLTADSEGNPLRRLDVVSKGGTVFVVPDAFCDVHSTPPGSEKFMRLSDVKADTAQILHTDIHYLFIISLRRISPDVYERQGSATPPDECFFIRQAIRFHQPIISAGSGFDYIRDRVCAAGRRAADRDDRGSNPVLPLHSGAVRFSFPHLPCRPELRAFNEKAAAQRDQNHCFSPDFGP